MKGLDTMTISEYARSRGVTPQAVYKRLSTKGIKVDNLRNQDKTLTPQGIEIIDKAMKIQPVDNQVDNRVDTVDNQVDNQVDNRLQELEKLLLAAEHRAELAEQKAASAEQRAAAAESERDYLREQLSASIKATALASMTRIEGKQESVKNRLLSAWSALRGK
ncbi:MAG: hypothetical protein II206_11085 [Bacteroidaceae bacterium]|nr:hypothetical protein [Bacteroidaceae bacterium]